MSSVWTSKRWIAASWDRLHPGRQILLGIEEWIFRDRSDFQEVAVARVPSYGIGLFLDGLVELLAHDEFIYHEALSLPPLLYHPAPRRVLIEGGGDGLALREVLRDPRVEKVVMVELDPVVLDACKRHLGELHQGSFDDARADIHVGDALAYLEGTNETFDVVLVDLLDAYDTVSVELYRRVLALTRRVLARGGIVSSFGDVSGDPPPAAQNFHAVSREFGHVAMHTAGVETFGGCYAFFLASNEMDFEAEPVEPFLERARQLRGERRALVPERFPGCLRWPPYLRQRIAGHRPHSPPRPSLQWNVGWIYPDADETESSRR